MAKEIDDFILKNEQKDAWVLRLNQTINLSVDKRIVLKTFIYLPHHEDNYLVKLKEEKDLTGSKFVGDFSKDFINHLKDFLTPNELGFLIVQAAEELSKKDQEGKICEIVARRLKLTKGFNQDKEETDEDED